MPKLPDGARRFRPEVEAAGAAIDAAMTDRLLMHLDGQMAAEFLAASGQPITTATTPEGGPMPDETLTPLQQRVRDVLSPYLPQRNAVLEALHAAGVGRDGMIAVRVPAHTAFIQDAESVQRAVAEVDAFFAEKRDG
jgi:hypothetical protein